MLLTRSAGCHAARAVARQDMRRVASLAPALLALCALALPARAGDASAAALPTLALNPQPPPSLWSGFHVGSTLFVIAGKGIKGRVGGALEAGYDREFANNLVVGIDAAAGFAPAWFPHGRVRGYDFAESDVKIGYDLGRLMPYVTTGLVLAKPNLRGGYSSPDDSFNSLFNSSSDLQASGTVGVGVDYQLTNNLQVGVGVAVSRGPAFVTP